jgi:hypothetical protein
MIGLLPPHVFGDFNDQFQFRDLLLDCSGQHRLAALGKANVLTDLILQDFYADGSHVA